MVRCDFAHQWFFGGSRRLDAWFWSMALFYGYGLYYYFASEIPEVNCNSSSSWIGIALDQLSIHFEILVLVCSLAMANDVGTKKSCSTHTDCSMEGSNFSNPCLNSTFYLFYRFLDKIRAVNAKFVKNKIFELML